MICTVLQVMICTVLQVMICTASDDLYCKWWSVLQVMICTASDHLALRSVDTRFHSRCEQNTLQEWWMSYHDECPTTMNVLPDTLATPSTPQTTEWMLHPEAFQSVYQRWWMPNTDQLTTRFNFQSVSPVPDTQTLFIRDGGCQTQTSWPPDSTSSLSHQYQTHKLWMWTPWPSVGGIGCICLSVSHTHPKRMTVVPRIPLLPPAHRLGWPNWLWFPYRLCLGYTPPLPDWDRLHPLAKLTGSHIDYVWDIHYHYLFWDWLHPLAKLTVVPILIMSGIYTTTTRLGPTSSIGQTDWFPYRLCLGYTLPLPDWDRLHPLAKLTGSHIDYVWDIHYHYQIGTDFIHWPNWLWFPYRLCLGYTLPLPLPDWDLPHPLTKLTVVPISIMSGIYTTTTRLGPTSSIGQTDCGSHIDYVWDIHYHYQIGTNLIHCPHSTTWIRASSNDMHGPYLQVTKEELVFHCFPNDPVGPPNIYHDGVHCQMVMLPSVV